MAKTKKDAGFWAAMIVAEALDEGLLVDDGEKWLQDIAKKHIQSAIDNATELFGLEEL